MRHTFLFILMLTASVLLIACGNGNSHSTDPTEWQATQYSTVNNFDGVSMYGKEGTVSSGALTVILENNSDKLGVYSDDFLVEKEIDGDWYEVPPIINEYGFNDIGYELPPAATDEFNVEWEWLYGDLEPGTYRVIKSMLDFRETGDFDTYYLAAKFTVD